MSVGAFWCEQAWLGGAEVADGVLLTVGGGRITDVEAGRIAPPIGATRLDGLILPGFANAHSHVFHRALRGRTHSVEGTFWTWRDRMYELAATLNPDTFGALAEATFAEMVLAGFTLVGEFHYLHHDVDGTPYADPNELGRRLIAAADRAGIRLTLLDTCYLHGGIGRGINEVQARFSDRSADDWAQRVSLLTSDDRCRIGAAVHSVRAVDPESIGRVATAANEDGLMLHAHVSEQPDENAECLAAYDSTPVGVFDKSGALSSRFTAVHATHLATDDIGRLAAAEAICCICPTTERELADGIGPTGALRHAGVEMCLGSDAHAMIDPFEEARAIELDERLAAQRRGTHGTSDLLSSATAVGYRSLGWTTGGMIAVGALADFVAVSFDSPRLAGTDRSADPLAGVLFAASPADVRHVVAGGDLIVVDGVHQRVDVVDGLERSITAAWDAAG